MPIGIRETIAFKFEGEGIEEKITSVERQEQKIMAENMWDAKY